MNEHREQKVHHCLPEVGRVPRGGRYDRRGSAPADAGGGGRAREQEAARDGAALRRGRGGRRRGRGRRPEERRHWRQ